MTVFELLVIGSCFAPSDNVVNGHLYGGPIYQVVDKDSTKLAAKSLAAAKFNIDIIKVYFEQGINWNYTNISCPKDSK